MMYQCTSCYKMYYLSSSTQRYTALPECGRCTRLRRVNKTREALRLSGGTR